MSERGKVTEAHRRRRAVVYVRQSTLHQVERNVESAARQYALRDRAVELGWPAESVLVVDARPSDCQGALNSAPFSGAEKCTTWAPVERWPTAVQPESRSDAG